MKSTAGSITRKYRNVKAAAEATSSPTSACNGHISLFHIPLQTSVSADLQAHLEKIPGRGAGRGDVGELEKR